METRIRGKLKKLLGCVACALVLAAMTLCLCFGMGAFSVKAETKGTCGAYGDNLTWTLESGVLTIEGNGLMKDYGINTRPNAWDKTVIKVIIKEGVTSIGNQAFYGCNRLAEVTIPDSVTEIGSGAFNGCTSLPKITVPESVKSLGGLAFEHCEGLTEVTLPSGIKNLESGTFSGCSGLTEITIPKGFTSIGEKAFADCTELITVNIPESVTIIGENAFKGCISLTEITIPEGVVTIQKSAFDGCRSLTKITLPSSIKSIGLLAFSGCDSLQEVYYPGTEAEWKEKVTVSYGNDPLTDHLIFGRTGPSDTPRRVGDVNGDGRVTSADRTYLARALANWDGYVLK